MSTQKVKELVQQTALKKQKKKCDFISRGQTGRFLDMCNTVIIRSLSFCCKKRKSKSELLNLVAVGGGVDRAEMWTKSVHFLDCTLALGHSSLWEKHYPLALVLLDRGNRGSGFKELGCNQKIQPNSPRLNNHARSLI